MQALLFDKKSASHGIGTLNTLAIACTVAGGILLINTDKAEHSKSEMQQYLVVKTVKADTRRGVYNPFALASKTPILAKKSTVRDWIVTDVEFEKNYNNRSILDNLLHKNTATKPASLSALSLVDVQHIFAALKPVKQALEQYYHQNQKWPVKLEDAGVEVLPQNISDLAITSRGKLTINIRGLSDIIHFSPKSLRKPIQWFCQTSIHNNLLGKDSDRLCIHNETLVSSVAPVVFPLHSLQQSR